MSVRLRKERKWTKRVPFRQLADEGKGFSFKDIEGHSSLVLRC